MPLLQSFITSIADAGRDLLDGRRSQRGLEALCRDLLSQRGEALGTALAREVLAGYEELDEDGRLAFFKMLTESFAPAEDDLQAAIAAYQAAPSPEKAQSLAAVAEAPRQTLIRRMNMAPGGTPAIVKMRKELLALLPDNPDLLPLDVDLEHLLSSWFNRGFLQLERIDWDTPAAVLEKLITYEAVHAIRDWSDLRRRLAEDRRCYGFFHPALPGEPLIFVEVALVSGLAGSVQALLDQDHQDDPDKADTAIFYSISNCQEGLRGISFGNFLIKQVVAELTAELPNLETFATLSPIPGFARWLTKALEGGELTGKYKKAARDAARLAAADSLGAKDEELAAALRALCARYLLREKRGNLPLDPVARFHLGNGARVEQINWRADISDKGLAQSHGLMVNYRYDLKRIEEYHEAYVNNGTVAAARGQRSLAQDAS